MLRTLAKSLCGCKKSSFATILLSVIEVAFEIIIPMCMSLLLDNGINGSNMRSVWMYGSILFGLSLFQLLTGVLSAHTASAASSRFASNLREDMYNNVQTFSFSNIDKFSISSIVTRLTTDVTNLQNSYQMLTRMAIRAPVMAIFSFVAAFGISRKISFLFLIMVPFLVLGLFWIVKSVHPIFKRVFHTYDDLNNVVQENVRGIRVVKSFNQEDNEIKKFEKVSQKVYQDFAKGERLISLNSPLMQFFAYLSMIGISWFGAKEIIACGNNASLGLTTGGLTALIMYATQILTSLMILSFVFAMLTISYSSAERVAELLQEETDIKSPSNAIKCVVNGDVQFKDVDFVYASNADKKVLSCVNINIKSGETVGIIGGTGSSKTSLVQLIPRLYDVCAGQVLVGGCDVREYDLFVLRDAVSMVLQKNDVFSGTIKENLRWGDENASDDEIVNACKIACADEFINTMPDKYDTYIEQGGSNISGGQKQRLCIARALLKKPKVLILDDSTSAVDMKTDMLIQRALCKYMPNTTKFIIAQRISSVQHADKIIVLNDGKVDMIGTHSELLEKNEIYRSVYVSQQKGDEPDEKK